MFPIIQNYHQLFLLSSVVALASCHPLNYQKVQFVGDSAARARPERGRLPPLNRNTRSFGFHPYSFPNSFPTPQDFWPTEFYFPPPPLTVLDVSYERGHITPDFSNGLDYPDPLLLTGRNAARAVKYLYGRELFYHQIPHVRTLLRNQEERRANGLDGNNLSSHRPSSPFYRH